MALLPPSKRSQPLHDPAKECAGRSAGKDKDKDKEIHHRDTESTERIDATHK